jgi:hypothetical protein
MIFFALVLLVILYPLYFFKKTVITMRAHISQGKKASPRFRRTERRGGCFFCFSQIIGAGLKMEIGMPVGHFGSVKMV